MYTSQHYTQPITLRAYGRNIQSLIRAIQAEQDPQKRTAYAKALIPIMVAVSTKPKTQAPTPDKVWQDLFTIAQQPLNIDVPFQPHPHTTLTPTTRPLYPTKPTHPQKRYGRHLCALLAKIQAKQDTAYTHSALLHIGKWILTFHKKRNNPDTILRFFQDTLPAATLPDLAPIHQALQQVAPNTPHKNTYPKKRYFKKRRFKPHNAS